MQATKKQSGTVIEHGELAKRIDIIRALNLPTCADNPIAQDWVYMLRALTDYMQWPHDQWSVTKVGRCPNDMVNQYGLLADVTFVCNRVSVVVQFGLYPDTQYTRHAWLSIDDTRKVDRKRIAFPSTVAVVSSMRDAIESTPLLDVIEEMANEVHEHVIKTAWKIGNGGSSP